MITVKRKYIFLMLASSIIFILISGIFGYKTVMNAKNLSENLVKFNAEQLIFLAILFCLTLILIFTTITRKSTNIERLLDRAIQVTKYGGRELGNIFKQMGFIGEKMNLLYEDLERVNKMKTSKIFSMNYLIEFFCENTDRNIFITDLSGTVRYISKKAADGGGIMKSEAVEKNISEMMENVNLRAKAAEMIKTRKPSAQGEANYSQNDEAKSAENKSRQMFYPVFDDGGDLSYIIMIYNEEAQPVFLNPKVHQETTSAHKKSYGEMLRFWKHIKNR